MKQSSSNKLWCAHFAQSGRHLKGLTTRELQAIVDILAQEQVTNLYVWHEGLTNWTPVEVFPELHKFEELEIHLKPPEKLPKIPKAMPFQQAIDGLVERSKKDELTFSGIQEGMIKKISDLDIESDNVQNSKRQFKRFDRSIRVELEHNGRVFRTSTKNISIGGMQIQDPLPQVFFGYFTAKIFDKKTTQFLTHTCWVVEDSDSRQRFHIVFLPFKKREAQDNFETWIKSAA